MRGTSRRGSYRAIIRGVWAPPKLLAEAKSDENERTKAESVGSDTPWADGPANLGLGLLKEALINWPPRSDKYFQANTQDLSAAMNNSQETNQWGL